MDVYASHRTCGVPDFVAANTRKNVGTARLNDDGWSTVPAKPRPNRNKSNNMAARAIAS